MGEAPTTRPSLLLRLRDARDQQAWGQFVDLYAPLVYGYLRKQGLQDADAADLTQAVLEKVAGAAGRWQYDPQRGTFRGWLFTIVRNKLRNFLASRHGLCRGTGAAETQRLLEAQPAPPDSSEADWERQWERRLFAWAADSVRGHFQESTWQAFWRTAVEGEQPAAVAASLGLSAAAVYLARSRVMARIKEQIHQVQDEGFPSEERSP